ncbi:MAG: response regulator transcription factor [Bacteroidota bacterium]|nr:response regulator transcription factor [Candidatus Kapabacteria bacterium]MDW8219846.1 response regulator transcription factor [Bacteroidota bacterium]
MTKILLIEDEERVARVIKRGLEEQQFSVVVGYDGQMGRKLLLEQDYDLVILDLVLPKMNGLDLCKDIRSTHPTLPILMLTALGTTDNKIEGFDAGADDYLVKPFDFRELLARIRVLLKRKRYESALSPTLISIADLTINYHTKTVTRSGKEIRLTPTEFKLLSYMAQNAGRLLSRAEIAEQVWNTTFDTGTNFIDVYMNYLRKKLDKDFHPKLIHTKVGMGYILRPEATTQ